MTRDLYRTAFMGVMLVIAGISLTQGDPRKLYSGMDYRGCLCGTASLFNPNTSTCSVETGAPSLGSKAISVYNPNSLGSSAFMICASACPSVDTPAGITVLCFNAVNGSVKFPSNSSLEYQAKWAATECRAAHEELLLTTDSRETAGHCLPRVLTDNATAAATFEAMETYNVGAIMESLMNARFAIGAGILLTFFVGMLYTQLIALVAGATVYVSMILANVGIIVCGLYLYLGAEEIKADFPDSYDSDGRWKVHYYGSFAVFAVAVLSCILSIFLLPRVRLAVKVLMLTGQAVAASPGVVLVPLVTTLLTAVAVLLWVVVSVFLFSIGDVVPVSVPNVPGGIARTVQFNDTMRHMFVLHFFGILWVMAALMAVTQMVVGFVGVSWYFAPQEQGKRRILRCLSFRMLCTVLRYHLGTVAFGSLLIATVQFLRAAFEYYMRVVAKHENNPLVKMMACCVRCCLWCIECCLKFVNKIAYIFVGLTGKSFVPASCKAIEYITTNIVRVGVLVVLKAVFLFIGKLITGAVPALLVFVGLRTPSVSAFFMPDGPVTDAYLPAVVVFLTGYTVGGLFASVLDTMSDAILMSYSYNEREKIISHDKDTADSIDSLSKQVEAGEKRSSTVAPEPSVGGAEPAASSSKPEDSEM